MSKAAARKPARAGAPEFVPIFFRSAAELRAWFATNAATAKEVWVGFHRVGTGRATLTWSQAVDEALCVGWIDGIRKRVDDTRYANRFTPRNPRSSWSAVNIRKVEALSREGRMQPAGVEAFRSRADSRSQIYSYEQRPPELVEPYKGIFRKENTAWAFYQAQPPYYRKVTTWWVVSAKKEETRLKRLRALIEDSRLGRRIKELARPEPSGRAARAGSPRRKR
jgi:uncharacterized protein YdeI (YjbR/CyaY-like superfamily)